VVATKKIALIARLLPFQLALVLALVLEMLARSLPVQGGARNAFGDSTKRFKPVKPL
jgi:hypothetical protein